MTNKGTAFKQPIMYNKSVRVLDESIIQDLELTSLILGLEEKDNDKIIDNDDKLTKPLIQNKTEQNIKKQTNSNVDQPIYECVFSPSNELGRESMVQLASHYTTDTAYLKDFQTLVKTHPIQDLNPDANASMNSMLETWKSIKGETSFCEKYSYIQWDFAKALNTNSAFMQLMSVYNIASPIISLCSPLLVLFIPFFILKIKQIPITLSEYGNILKGLMQSNPICKIFTQFSELDAGQKAYSLISGSFYLFTIYQNVLSCIRFYMNMRDIHAQLDIIKNYVKHTLLKMRAFSDRIKPFVSLTNFKEDFDDKINQLHLWKLDLDEVSVFSFSFGVFKQFGTVLSKFYNIYMSEHTENIVSYSFGFHGFLDVLDGLCAKVNAGQMKFASYSKSTKENQNNKDETNKLKKEQKNKHKTKFKRMYYPKFIESSKTIKNDCSLSKNIIITAPNGGGKTTMLKSVLINMLLCQQVGAGCFDKAMVTPYSQFHCYLNIPDTSGRDSLFQAEARRCKTILDKINLEKETTETHLCIFDELYSGTNPDEAVESASAFMKYLTQKNNVSCMLTTHYTKLCKNLDSNTNIVNMHMGVKESADDFIFQYTFKMEKGISVVKGGLKVLKDMNYPEEILASAKQLSFRTKAGG